MNKITKQTSTRKIRGQQVNAMDMLQREIGIKSTWYLILYQLSENSNYLFLVKLLLFYYYRYYHFAPTINGE